MTKRWLLGGAVPVVAALVAVPAPTSASTTHRGKGLCRSRRARSHRQGAGVESHVVGPPEDDGVHEPVDAAPQERAGGRNPRPDREQQQLQERLRLRGPEPGRPEAAGGGSIAPRGRRRTIASSIV